MGFKLLLLVRNRARVAGLAAIFGLLARLTR